MGFITPEHCSRQMRTSLPVCHWYWCAQESFVSTLSSSASLHPLLVPWGHIWATLECFSRTGAEKGRRQQEGIGCLFERCLLGDLDTDLVPFTILFQLCPCTEGSGLSAVKTSCLPHLTQLCPLSLKVSPLVLTVNRYFFLNIIPNWMNGCI